MERIRCIAWDFDGVLNRNVENGRFVWQDELARIGIDRKQFVEHVFSDGFWPVMRGEEDLLDRLARFYAEAGLSGDPQELLHFWFETDARVCPNMLALMEEARAAGLRQVIATNNEHRRSSYIEVEMGFGERVEMVFSSARLGVAKPDAGYFRAIEERLGLAPEEIFFVDDYRENVEGARQCGWQVHHFAEDGHAELRERLAPII